MNLCLLEVVRGKATPRSIAIVNTPRDDVDELTKNVHINYISKSRCSTHVYFSLSDNILDGTRDRIRT